MSLYLYPLAAAAGALVGSVVHESIHAGAAWALGELEAVGWQGGVAGGPCVDYRVATRWRSEVVRKAPLVAGVVALAHVVLPYEAPTLPWVAAAAATLGLLWTSPEDLFVEAAQQD